MSRIPTSAAWAARKRKSIDCAFSLLRAWPFFGSRLVELQGEGEKKGKKLTIVTEGMQTQVQWIRYGKEKDEGGDCRRERREGERESVVAEVGVVGRGGVEVGRFDYQSLAWPIS